MADSDPKRPAIPEWQRRAAESTSSNQQNPSSEKTTTTAPTRAALLDQATKFLQDASIVGESTERKTSFLKSKGLSEDEVRSVLSTSSKSTGTSDTATTTATEEGSEAPSTSPTDSSSAGDGSSSNTPALGAPPSSSEGSGMPHTAANTPSSSSSSSSSSPSSTSPQSSASRDIPPIITYPEFLLQPSKPPPLVSIRSVLYSLYSAAALGTGLYAASEYLVKPMLANLAGARHELSEAAHENLKTLNEKLEQNVSIVPPHLSSARAVTSTINDEGEEGKGDEEDESESITSDPTELWHRDVATQTSPESLLSPTSENPADTTTTPDSDTPNLNPTEKVASHLQRLDTINSCLREYIDSENKSSSVDDATRNRLTDLHTYLEGMTYSSPLYGTATGYGVFSTPGIDSSGSGTVGVGKNEEDAISNFKSEIRGVKGALLSARNFPAGGARRGVGVGASAGK